MAEHYGVLIDPARADKPKDKPRVERPMPYVRDSFWAGRSFASLEQMQAAAQVWARQVAGRRSCRPLGGAAPLAVFEAVEAPALRPLSATPFELASWSTPKVGRTVTSRSARRCTRCRGGSSAVASTRAPAGGAWSCSVTGS